MFSGSSSSSDSSRGAVVSYGIYSSSLRAQAFISPSTAASAYKSHSYSGASSSGGVSATSVSTPQYSVTSQTFNTPISGVASTGLTSTSAASEHPSTTLDIGPPGWTATIRLWENTNRERTIYLGPWQVVGGSSRRVIWQCSYRGESIEHFLPSGDVHPHTLHRNHRQFSVPNELELFVNFREPHRLIYRDPSGTIVHDARVDVKYEFSACEISYQFQGDIRGKDLIDYFDVDVVYSDHHARQNNYGAVSGLGTIQRLKLWKDRYASYYTISVYSNRLDPRRYREYQAHLFEPEIRNIDDAHRRLRLYVRGRRGSAPDGGHNRNIFGLPLRPRQRSIGGNSHANHEPHSLRFRYLGIQFTDDEDYTRFFERWGQVHSEGWSAIGVPFPPDAIEMEGDVPTP